MRSGIHPDYVECQVTCSCGSKFTTRSTSPELHVELCSQCHPYYTGKQKFVDTGGRVQRFSDKFGGAAETVMAQDAAKKEARQKAHEESEAKLRELRAAKEAAEAERVRNAPKAPVVEEVVEVAEAVDATPDETPAEQDAAE